MRSAGVLIKDQGMRKVMNRLDLKTNGRNLFYLSGFKVSHSVRNRKGLYGYCLISTLAKLSCLPLNSLSSFRR